MDEKERSEHDVTTKPIAEYTDEDWERMRQIDEEFVEQVRERREREERGEFDDLPHMVSFSIDCAQTQSVMCRTRAFPDKERAQEAKSKLEQVECVRVGQVERV